MKALSNLWTAWGNFWTARADAAAPNRDMMVFRGLARILNIQN